MKTVLIIEDDTILRENIAEMLEFGGYAALLASDGTDGLALARTKLPDIILCDIMMPGIDGYDVLRLLSTDPLTSSIPFIFVSAKSEVGDVRKGMSLGADDYLTKPFAEEDVIQAIESRLKRSEVLKQDYAATMEGLHTFIDNVHELSSLKGLCEDRIPRLYKRKEVVYYESDDPHFFYFLEKGKIKKYKRNEDEKELITGFVDEGEFFGHLPILENKPYSETTEVIENASVLRIPKEDLYALLKKDREVCNAFIKVLTRKIYADEKLLLSLAYDSVRKRTANALLDFLDRFKENKQDSFLEISRSDLADMIGTSTESVIRTLSDFKEERLINLKGRTIEVVNRPGLEAIF